MCLIVKTHVDQKGKQQDYFNFISTQQQEKFEQFIENTNGLFVVENENMEKGGKIQWDDEYWLRHLTTNRYLHVCDYPLYQTMEEII